MQVQSIPNCVEIRFGNRGEEAIARQEDHTKEERMEEIVKELYDLKEKLWKE